MCYFNVMNLKKLFFLTVTIITCFVVHAEDYYPQFSTQEKPIWYFVKFKAGRSCLSDQGAGKPLTTVAMSREDANLWQFIGTKENFLLKSRKGNYVVYKDGMYHSEQSKGIRLKLIMSPCFNAMGGMEIQQQTSTRPSMSRSVSKDGNIRMIEKSMSNGNNILSTVPAAAPMPEFSARGREIWYHIHLKDTVRNLEDAGTGKAAALNAANDISTQFWKLTGSPENFQLTDKAGNYLVAGPILTTSRKKPAEGFRLAENDNMEFAPSWAIQTASGKSMGQLEKAPVLFISGEDMDYNEFQIEGNPSFKPENMLTLWYRKPATLGEVPDKWMEYALPLGNGRFGASIYGGVWKDEIQFNEKSLWSGRNTDNSVEYGDYENFGSIFAENLAVDEFSFDGTQPVTDYVRGLDLDKAKAFVQFSNSKNNTTYRREYITSNPAKVLAAHYTCSGKEKLHLRFTLNSGKPGIDVPTHYRDGSAEFSGKLETVSYSAMMKVSPAGGKMVTTDKGIEIHGADEILVILGGSTDFDPYSSTFTSRTAELPSQIAERVEQAAERSWKSLYEEHLKDYRSLFGRCQLKIDGAGNTMATDEMIDKYKDRSSGTEDYALMLEQLYFAYGRYLEIASSRDLALPSNLQGIWNNFSETVWNADIHANINVQMNYWPSEPTNLSETHLPFLDYIINMATNHNEWKGYARDSGQDEGWTCYTENNIFGGVGSFRHGYVIANAWYCTHLWQHYRYTLDKEYLKRAFPAMWTASRFWITRLIKAEDGTYECPREYSPEQGPLQNGVAHAQQIVWELLDNTLKAVEILGKDAKVSTEQLALHKDRFEKLDKGLAIETYDGAWGEEVNGIRPGDKLLKEWKYDPYSRGRNGHRHVSHLMGLYPLNQITASSPYFEPAKNSLRLRGDASTGWSMGWKICLWARAADGNHAHDILELALRHHEGRTGGVYYNLFDSHPPFQIDGNFGACAGIAEMLMQSYSESIRILPALPDVWKKGEIKGMKAVNDFTVDIAWDNLKPTTVTVTSNKGMPLFLEYKDIASQKVTVNGRTVQPVRISNDKIEVKAGPGDKVTVTFKK